MKRLLVLTILVQTRMPVTGPWTKAHALSLQLNPGDWRWPITLAPQVSSEITTQHNSIPLQWRHVSVTKSKISGNSIVCSITCYDKLAGCTADKRPPNKEYLLRECIAEICLSLQCWPSNVVFWMTRRRSIGLLYDYMFYHEISFVVRVEKHQHTRCRFNTKISSF